MSRSFLWALARTSALLLAVLVPLESGNLLAQQQSGRQQTLTVQQVDSLRSAIQELGGRAIIGFKPVEAARGMQLDGTPALSPTQVRDQAAGLFEMGVVVLRQFQLVPAVAVRMDPDRIGELLARFDIDYVEPDVLHEPTGIPEIPDRDAVVIQETPWGINRVNAPAAWSITKGVGAKLGIIDTGIDENHPDLNVLGGINLVTGGTLRSDWDDNSAICITHGTHVAGSAAALDNTLDNTDHVVGVAPEAELYALRVFDPESAGISFCAAFTSDIIAAFDWAVLNELDVVNLSLGSPFPSISQADAISAAFSAGVVVIASSGNEGAAVGFPAGFPDAIAVAAMDEVGVVAFFSNHGPEVDIAGPGVLVLSTFGGGGTALLSGTSMASAHVAGVATLIRAAAPGLSATDVREILRNTADDIATSGYDEFAGYGVVDAEAATKAVGTPGLLALSTVPGLLTLAAEPGGAPVTKAIEIRNVGDAGTINWTASVVGSWLSLSATSGTATDVTPGTLDVTADPTGLAAGLYTGFVTIAGDAENSPAQIRVRLAVAPRIPLDATVETAGEIPDGERQRFLFSGTTGQLIDVAILTDFFDPLLRIYMPDGETLLALNDDAFLAGLGLQSLVASVLLPEDGDYIAEVGSYADGFGGGFILKARLTGPILAFSPPFISLSAVQGGVPVEAEITVFNLTGVGTLDFEITTTAPWLSFDPGSGTASTSSTLVAASGTSTTKVGNETPPKTGWDRLENGREFGSSEEKRRYEALERARQWNVPDVMAGPAVATVTLRADPGSLVAGDFVFGSALFTTSDDWLPPELFVDFLVYTAGMQIIAEGQVLPWGLTTDGPDHATGASANDNGSLFPIEGGVLGAPFATDVTPFPAGVTAGQDGNWYVGSNSLFDPNLRQVLPGGGSSIFATFPDNPFWVITGPEGEFYTSVTFMSQVYKVSSDGSLVEPFGGTGITTPGGLAYDPIEDVVYVARGFESGIAVLDANGDQIDVIALNMNDPRGLTLGASGNLYIGSGFGQVWVYDLLSGGPDAELLGFTPGPGPIHGLTLVEGSLLMSSLIDNELYSFPVDDGPVDPEGSVAITVQLDADNMMNLSGALNTIREDDFRIPLTLDLGRGATAVANYTLELGWDAAKVDFLALDPGDFTTGPGSFVANTSGVAGGSLAVTGAEPGGRGSGGGDFSLLTLDLVVNESVGLGDVLALSIDVTELGGPLNEPLLPVLIVLPGQICLSDKPVGDLTLDGVASAADATQILRSIVGLPLAPDTDLDRGDVTADGNVGVGDVVDILRNLVGLTVPPTSHVDKLPLEACP